MSSQVGGLRVYTETENGYEELPQQSTRYGAVASVIDLGLRVLETLDGRRSLVDIAIKAIKERREKNKHHLYGNRSLDEMSPWIDFFLTCLRSSFPDVYLMNMSGEGEAERYEWGDDMARYDPKSAVELHLNRTIIHNMIHAESKNSDSCNMFKFQMAITVAHEVNHFLIGFLTGRMKPPTPPGISLASYGNTSTGESGRHWERMLLGGVVEFYEEIQDPLGNMQAGTPYLIADGRSSAPAWLVSKTYINEFLSGTFSFPVRTSSTAETTTRSELRRISRETSDLRRRNATRNTSPVRGGLLAEQPSPATSSELAGETYHTERRSRNSGNDSWPNDWYADPWDGGKSRWFQDGRWTSETRAREATSSMQVQQSETTQQQVASTEMPTTYKTPEWIWDSTYQRYKYWGEGGWVWD